MTLVSFSFGVSGHGGPGVIPSDEDEGARARQFMSDVLDLGVAHGLSVAINNVSPESWQPDVRQKVAAAKPQEAVAAHAPDDPANPPAAT